LWWGRSKRPWDPRAWLDASPRRQQKRVLRAASDPEHVWHAGQHWQRSLTNKWNAREFAKRHDCELPELYWSGVHAAEIPFDTLPEQFVIRPAWGAGGEGVFVLSKGWDALRLEQFEPAEVVALVERERKGTGHILLVEEYMKDEAGEYGTPVEYKCHMFGGEVGAVQVVVRNQREASSAQICHTAEWKAFDEPIFKPNFELESAEPPACLDDMLLQSRRLGRAYASYVRVDFFATSRGAVFNEFASIPRFVAQATPAGDAYFDALWREHCPDAT
jgi:hypothetical protein